MPARWELAASAAIAFSLATLFFATQDRLPDRGVRWDGVDYVKVATDLVAGQTPLAGAPFVSRLGFPALAALTSPADPVSGMIVISLIAGVLSVLLMWYWLRGFQILSPVRLALVLAFALQFHGPLRASIFLPTLTYPLFWVFLLLGLILFRRASQSTRLSPALIIATLTACFVGGLVRETMLIVPVAMSACAIADSASSQRRRTPYLWLVMFGALSCLIAVGLARLLTEQSNDYEFVSSAIDWLDRKSLLELAAASFLAFGPMLAVLISSPRQTYRFWTRQPEIPALIIICAVIAVVGGSNAEVFLYWAAPAVLASVAVVLTQRASILLRPLPVTMLVLAQLIAQRAFWNFPLGIESEGEPTVLFSPLGDAAYLQLWAHFQTTPLRMEVVVTNLAFIGLYAAVAEFLHRRSRNPKSQAPHGLATDQRVSEPRR